MNAQLDSTRATYRSHLRVRLGRFMSRTFSRRGAKCTSLISHDQCIESGSYFSSVAVREAPGIPELFELIYNSSKKTEYRQFFAIVARKDYKSGLCILRANHRQDGSLEISGTWSVSDVLIENVNDVTAPVLRLSVKMLNYDNVSRNLSFFWVFDTANDKKVFLEKIPTGSLPVS